MSKQSISAKARVARVLAEDPNYFKRIRAKSKSRGGFYFLMENDYTKLKSVSSKGGTRSQAKREAMKELRELCGK